MLTLDRTRTTQAPLDDRPRAVVIGSGFGGLAAAVRLGARGYRVTVLEKLNAPGGRASVHRQDGFTFDAGPTIITALFLFEELWALCGRKLSDDVELRACDPFYRIRFSDGETFTYTGDSERMRSEIARFSPGDVEGYSAFLRKSEEICHIGIDQYGDVPFNTVFDMLRLAPDIVRLQGYRSVHGFVSQYIKNDRLRSILSYHPLLIGGNPYRASAIYCSIAHFEKRSGVHYAMGGTGSLIRGLVKLIEGQGGEVRCGAQVGSIVVENGAAKGVTLSSGETIRADIVVSNADTAWTYIHLLPASARKRWTDRKVERQHSSMGLFVWYFGTRKQYPDIGHHTLLFGPRHRELLKDIFDRKVLADDFSIYLHRPTATDPSMAPPGCDAFYALSPVPNLAGGQDWAKEAEPYRLKIVKALEASIMPGLSTQIATSRVTTPQDFEDNLLAYRGAAFGMEPILTQSAWFRPHNLSEDVRNLFLVGAGTHPGAGVPSVLLSARILDKVAPDASVFA